VQDFRNLAVWKKAHELTLSLYSASASYPQHETFGLRSQIRRTAANIPCRIADGCGCSMDAEFVKFLYAANSQASELEYLLILSRDLNYFDQAAYDKHSAAVVEVRRMLMGLVRSINS
jgi:four helix bundle protein